MQWLKKLLKRKNKTGKGFINFRSKNSDNELISKSNKNNNNKCLNEDISDLSTILKAKGYKIGHQIGEGSYSKVNLAYKEEKEMAVKIIDNHQIQKKFLIKFLPRELEILKKLDHKNVIKVYDVLRIENKTFIFMEFVSNGDLLGFVSKENYLGFTESQVQSIFLQLVEGLDYCHQNSISHRDLKLENVLLTNNNIVKLCDFGFAKQVDRDSLMSTTYCGSYDYAAPEILLGKCYDPKISDVWSLGVIFYFLLFNILPFDASDVPKMINCQLSRQMILWHQLKNTISIECQALICQLLEPDPIKRPALSEVLQNTWLSSAKIKFKSPLPV